MTPAPSDSLLTNLRLPDGGPAGRRIAIKDGRIAAIMPACSPDPDARQVLDLGGGLLLPGLVDGHMHLDKTLFGLPWQPHAAEPFRQSRIDTDQRVLPALPLDAADRAGHLMLRCVANGTAHIRTHADIVPAFGLSALEGALRAREAHAHAVTVQVVAFPQAGVMRQGGAPMLDLLDAAIRAGADLVGGIDPCEMDHSPSGQLDGKHAGAEMDVGAAQPDQFGGPKARLGIEVEQCRVASSGPGRPIRRGQQGIDFRLGQIGHEPSLEAIRRNG